MAPGGSGWLRVAPGGSGWLRLAPGGSGSGEDAWKAIGIAEVMQKAGCTVPPEMKQAVRD